MSVRITGGRDSGRRLLGPPRPGRGGAPPAGLRPSAARLRKSLFEVLADELPGSTVLDLCAGVGALGFEALSRGARRCLFLERAPRMARLIERNAERLGAEAIEIRIGDAERELRRLVRAGARFGVVLLDPPWDLWESGAGERLLAGAARLIPEVVAAEHRSSFAPPEAAPDPGKGPAMLVRRRTTAVGDGAFSLYRPAAETREPSIQVKTKSGVISSRFRPPDRRIVEKSS